MQDLVAEIGEKTGLCALKYMRDEMLYDSIGRRILRERPVVHSSLIDLHKLSKLPNNTFGFAYSRFLENHKVTPDLRTDVKFIHDEELSYVMTRYRQVHDFWHTLANLPITVEAELGLKLFEYFQTSLPMNKLAATIGILALNNAQRSKYLNAYIPWALSCSLSSVNLMNVMYEDHFELPIEEVQDLLGIISAPS